jgi:hypothetical protein
MKKFLLTLSCLLLTSQAAIAGPQCDAPKEKWIPAEQFKQNLQQQGYTIKNFKETKGNCYEIYGTDKSGKKVEIYFDPATGNIVKQK